jgi:hypothetical protein
LKTVEAIGFLARPLESDGMIRKIPKTLLVVGVAAVGLTGLYATARHLAADSARIEVWHGLEQRVGHLGDAQDDFNLLGRVPEADQLFSLQYGVNDATPVELSFRGYRRLAADGHFNADIPVASLAPGQNTVTLEARFLDGEVARRVVTVTRMEGATPLPVAIDWAEVDDPQDVGQYVDGEWRQGEHGLRPAHVGYDRLFLIGDRDWQDYEVTAEVILHRVTAETAPASGGNGLGLIMRFAGHSVGGAARFPVAQPKWGYQPFGAIAWLRWQRGDPDGPAVRQFLGGGEGEVDHGTIALRPGERYVIKARAETLPDDAEGRGVTRYAFKIWSAAAQEPADWDWQEVHASRDALRSGALGLLAHHVDASFGRIRIVALAPGTS